MPGDRDTMWSRESGAGRKSDARSQVPGDRITEHQKREAGLHATGNSEMSCPRLEVKTAAVFLQPAFLALEISIGSANEGPEARRVVVLKDVAEFVKGEVFDKVRR